MTEEEQTLGGPITGRWPFPILSKLRERETSSVGQEGAINRALERAPKVIVKHMGRAVGQTAADIVGNAAADSVGEHLSGILTDRPLLRRRGVPPVEKVVEEVK